MGSRRLTYRELEETLRSVTDAVSGLKAKIDAVQEENGLLRRANESLQRRLEYYENSNSPPSADSLEWRRQKRERARQRKEGGGSKEGKKPGGRAGHPGTSRKHSPQKTEKHGFPVGASGEPILPRCACGGRTRMDGHKARDIVDVRIETFETRHVTEQARCECCGAVTGAPDGLPRKGSYGRGLVGMLSEVRALRVPHEGVARFAASALGVKMAKSTVINSQARSSDRMKDEFDCIMGKVLASDSLGVDETGMPLGGRDGWAWTIQSGKNIAVVYSKSRGSLVPDTYLDKYGGAVVSDGLSVYKRFDPGGRHQICWAHELRNARHASQKDGAAPEAALLHGDLKWTFGEAKRLAERGHSARQRLAMNHMLSGALDRYRHVPDGDLQKLLARLDRHLPNMFTFLEYPGVEPTNNASERALRYVVVFRKTSGQIKGGYESMKRMSYFVTCVLTWRAHGKSVAQEVARLI